MLSTIIGIIVGLIFLFSWIAVVYLALKGDPRDTTITRITITVNLLSNPKKDSEEHQS